LTKEQNSFVAWSTLVAAAKETVEEVGEELHNKLREIARTRRAPLQALEDLRRSNDPKGAVLANDKAFALLVMDLTENFLLLTLVREPQQRRVLKFSYVSRMQPETEHSRIRRFLGWRPFRFGIPLYAVGEAGSFHFEMAAPDGLWISGEGEVRHRDTLIFEKPALVIDRQLLHLYFQGFGRLATGRAAITLQPRYGFVQRIFSTATFNAVLLVLGAVFFDHISRKVSGNSVDAGVAVLLVASSTASAYVSRPGEHAVPLRALFGLRLIGLLSGLASYVAAIMLTVGPVGWAGHIVWIVLAAFTAIASLALLRTFLVARESRPMLNGVGQVAE
jgi:hypothetical protein